MDKILLTAEECAQVLGVGRSFIYSQLLATGRLESLKLGRRRLIPREAVMRFIEEERERQAEEAGR